jgi:protein-L-isoaspartate(D-aspartate) O-methyltransferase
MPELSLATARHNMIVSQIRTWDVFDDRLLALLERAPREAFVPAEHRALAYADLPIPLGHGEVMMTPIVEARLLQALDVGVRDRVLEIGTGSGYVTWLLASLAREVTSVEIREDFSEAAASRLATHGARNVKLSVGDGARGWGAGAPFDVIFLTGSVPLLAETFRHDLAVGGRLVAITGQAPVMTARLITRLGENSFSDVALFETVLPPLVNAPAPERFVF